MALLATAVALTCLAGCGPRDRHDPTEPHPGATFDGRAAVVYSPDYQIDLWGFERSGDFDVNKAGRIADSLVADGLVPADGFSEPAEIDRASLLLVHTAEYLERLTQPRYLAEYLGTGAARFMPASLIDERVLRPFRVATGGTLLAARLALSRGLAVNLGGGYHLAHPERGEGFCVYADVPVAVRVLQKEGLVGRVLVINLNVHQGSGVSDCFVGDERVFTFGIYEEGLWPRPGVVAGDLDRGIAPPASDAAYLALLASLLPPLLGPPAPDLVIYMAGVDTWREDPNGHLAMTAEGIARRDAYVAGEVRRRGIPLVIVAGGGYAPEAWRVQYRSIANLLERFAGIVPGGK